MERLPSFLEGPRLTLRQWEDDDAGPLGEAIEESLPQLTPFMPWAAVEPISLDARLELFELWDEKWKKGGDSYLAMVDDGAIVGGTGLHSRGHEARVEIGYWVRTTRTGEGYATEAARLLTAAGLELPFVQVVAIHHDRANIDSRRIPEKLGYRLAREIETDVDAPGQIGRELQWEMTRDLWAEVGA